jgi:hypothetical protein
MQQLFYAFDDKAGATSQSIHFFESFRTKNRCPVFLETFSPEVRLCIQSPVSRGWLHHEETLVTPLRITIAAPKQRKPGCPGFPPIVCKGGLEFTN